MTTESIFYIVINLRTVNGFESFGKFCVGNNRAFADLVFRQLKGRRNVSERTVLTLDLMETRNGLPINMEIISCTLDELAENCKTITKETFKSFSLESL